jgi:hypothetical protein
LPCVLPVLLLAACYPGGPEEASDLGAVITLRPPEADYAGLLTFAMADTVYVLDVDDSSAEPLDPTYNPVILEELRAQMVAAGFRDVTPDTATVAPDVWLSVGAVQAEVWFYWGSWGYWGGWWYYPPTGGMDSFTNGSVLWQLVDIRGVDDGGDPVPVWLAGINGVVQNSISTTSSGIRKGIDQAFYQSPYIQGDEAKRGEGSS